MTFRDNLQYLRGTRDMSQAELAQMLGVSRQSVAKWEAEKSYPEMDKLIKICDSFACSLDDLVRGDLAHAASDETGFALPAEAALEASSVAEVVDVPHAADADDLPQKSAPPADVYGYDEHMRSRAWDVSAGVAVAIASIGVDFFVTGGHARGSLAGSLAVYLVGVAVVLALVVPTYRAHQAFQRQHPHIEDFYTPARKRHASSRKMKGVAASVGLVVAGMLSPALFASYYVVQFGSLSLFCFLALAAAVAVYAVMMEHRVDVSRYNAAAERLLEKSTDAEQPTDPVELFMRLKNAVLLELRR